MERRAGGAWHDAFKRARRLIAAIGLAGTAIVLATPPARAWNSRTHELIARLAVGALPQSPLRVTLAHDNQLEEDAIAPDFTLKRQYGHAEAIRHYIDLEDYGSDPIASLNPDINAMRQRYGDATLERSGTLPWTIEQVSASIALSWRRDDCRAAETLSGYLAHYIGDASQPLHSTRYYDGVGEDRGIHARLEFATDADLAQLTPLARPAIKLIPVTSAWEAAIAEIRRANALIPAITRADRAARAASPPDDHQAYNRALMAEEGPLLAGQIADASSVLASVWLYEWKSAGSPAACAAGLPAVSAAAIDR